MPNGGPEVSPTSIDALRAKDAKDKNLTPETQTLNDKRILDFLQRPGAAPTFGFEQAIQLTAEGKTKTEAMLCGKFKDAKKILDSYGRIGIMDESKEVMLSQLENLKTPPANMKQAEAKKIMEAKDYYDLVKEHTLRLQNVVKASVEGRKDLLTQTKGIGDTIKEKLGGAMENWDKLSSGQKMLMAGVAFLGGIWFMKSQNDTIKGIRGTLMTGLKIAGGAWLFNKVWYLFSGESFVDYASDKIKGKKSGDFLKLAFRTDDKGAELMSKALVHLGEVPFMGLLDQYETGKGTITETKMPPNEAYAAMDLFVKKYGAKNLREKYAKYNPPISFSQAAIIEMSNDPEVKMQEGLTSRVTDTVSDWFKRGYNYLASSAAGVWMAKKYQSWFGKEPTKDELQDFSKKFGEIVNEEKEVNTVIKDRLLRNDPTASKNYTDTNLSGKVDAKYGLKYRRAADGYVYMIVDKPLNNVNNDEKVLDQTVQSAIDTAENFLVEQFKADKSTVSGKCQPHGTIFVANTTTLKYLVRYKAS